jgi:hypothetical protein
VKTILAALAAALFLVTPVSIPEASALSRTGIGVVLLRPLRAERAGDLARLVLYAEPGIRRIAVLDAALLPSLSPGISTPDGEYALAVSAKRGDWLCIAYDDADRSGWIRRERYWDFFVWTDYLPGRTATFPPGARTQSRTLRASPSGDSPALTADVEGQPMRILQVEGDWIRVSAAGGATGWLRWRDGYGRMLIEIGATAR